MLKKYKIENIQWDTDDDTDTDIIVEMEVISGESISDRLTDVISDYYGIFTPSFSSFSYQEIN